MGYNGFFNSFQCKKYEVRITPSGDTSGEYTEIPLAAEDPFVVRYAVSNTPFEPVRTSTASISIVNDEYLYDALSNCAQGTKVELLDITTPNNPDLVWVGFLTPKVYNAGYDSCWETFDLEAADCISSLQYIDYVETSGGGITNIQTIVNQICDATKELDGYYWTISKKTGAGEVIRPEMLSISEHNFQTNDTAEEWKLKEVLEELCRYLGFTCFQWKNYMYFIDYQYLEPNTRIKAYRYSKAGGYQYDSTQRNLLDAYQVTASSIMGNGSSISLEPVYNKVVVNANMYAVDDFIPNPFDDQYLTNRIDSNNFYASVEIPPYANNQSDHHYNQWYPNGSDAIFWQSMAMEKEADDKYIYYMRPYDHKYWESYYTNVVTGGYAPLTPEIRASSACTRDYRGGTLVDFGVVRKEHKSESNPSQWIIPSKMDYTRYICISERHTDDHEGSRSTDKGKNKVVYKLKDGYKSRAMFDDKCFLVLNCTCTFERYYMCNYINPEWCNAPQKKRGTQAGSWHDSIPKPKFKIQIGNKCWSSHNNRWITAGSLTEEDDYCTPTMKWDEKDFGYWNKELDVLNNVSWEDKVNAEGLKFPLSGVNTTDEIKFEIINPDPTFYGNTGSPNFEHIWYDMNAYCWISDLSLKVVREGESDLGSDNDVVYENVMDECSINDMSEIRVRITTFTDTVKPSYSHMIIGSGFLETVLEEAQGNVTAQKPEENIIQKYVHQYQTPTKKIVLPLPINIAPFQKLYGVNVDDAEEGYVVLGSEMDFRYGRQTITAVQKDK